MLRRVAGIGVVLLSTGCAIPTRAPLQGILYTGVKSGVAATAQPVGNRVGESCAISVLGIVAAGDASIDAARRDGGIAAITSVDERNTGFLGLFAQHCTIVRGK